MIRKFALVATTSALLLAGCGGGDIEINPSTVDNSVNNSNNTVEGGDPTADNPCASYDTDSGQTREGSFDGTNCTYSTTFVDAGNSLMVPLDIPALPDGGAHIFLGSLFVGGVANSDEELADLGVEQGGDGPTLTIEAGATLAWEDSSKFMVINRGSQIFAVGRADAPITLTSVSDVNGDLAVEGLDGAEAVSQWGGLVINGFGVTNNCDYVGTRGEADFALVDECHIPSEGSSGADENFYGGDNDDDNSGRLEFFMVKHTGAEVGNGDELNGITFSGVGRGTTVRNIQAYSTFDDGIEMFGGAVSVTNYAGIYVRDDSIDVDEGWMGSVDTALVIQGEERGNHCIEADGIAGFNGINENTPEVVEDFITRGLHTQAVISNMTCIFSPQSGDLGDRGPGAGVRFREGIAITLRDSMVISSFGEDDPVDTNYCLRVDNRSQQQAQDGNVVLDSVVFACADLTNGGSLPNGTSVEDWATDDPDNNAIFATIDGVVNATSDVDGQLRLLEGEQPIFSLPTDQMQVDDADLPFGTSDESDILGVLSVSEDNPFAGWTFGIFPDNRTQPLWFEAQP